MFAYTKIMQGIQAVSAAVTDAYFNLVTLLLPGNGTNGAQNNTFLDSSSNNFTITRNGNTTQGTFSPFSQTGWSNYFSGSQSLSNATSVNASGDFTLECWLCLDSYSAARIFFSVGNETADRRAFFIDSSGVIKIDLASVGATSLGGVVPLNTWTHIAITRSGSTVTAYVNGIATGTTGTISGTFGNANGFYVGSVSNNSNSMVGYISNLRWVLGSVVYTSNFTPPTSPLTSITNTSILTCQSSRFVDNSSNAYALTVNGTPSVQAFSPFAPTAAYSAATNGGSGYFDGTGDYLSVSRNTAFIPTTGDFTIEAWVYPTTSGTSKLICGLIEAGDNADWTFFIYTDNTIGLFAGSTLTDTFGPVVTVNQWNHVAMSRTGSTLYRCVNGTATTVTFTSNLDNGRTYPLTIGADQNGDELNLTGWIGGVRIIKGTALYTSTTYTVPTAPFTNVTNTGFLANFTNAGITDATAKNDLETVGNAQISTTQSKFGGSSMYFDGTGDVLTIPVNALFNQTGDWTVECWFYRVAAGTTWEQFYGANGTNGFLQLGVTSSTNAIRVDLAGTGAVITGSAVTNNVWNHAAMVKNGTTLTLFLNGVSQGTYTASGVALTSKIQIGGSTDASAYYFNGYLDDLRVTRYARYTANFTPPTAAFALQ